MNRSLFAIAILSTSAGIASAQTAVTVYGIMDTGMVYESGGPAGSVTKMESGVQSGSRLGFKGNEDLGGGLSANFVIEAGFDVSNGTSNQGGLTFGRETSVGLSGGFGTIKFGRFYNVITKAVGAADPFTGGHEGAFSNIMNFATRTQNAVDYITPAIGGFTGELSYGFGEVAGNSSASRDIAAAIGYANGPGTIKLARESKQNPTGSNALTITNLNGTYNFGPAKLGLVYNVNKDNVNVNSSDWLAGVTVPFGASTFLASYIRHKDKTALRQDASQVGLGYTYNLSKLTNLYASYGLIKNYNGARYTVGNSIDLGTGDKGLAVGVRHLF